MASAGRRPRRVLIIVENLPLPFDRRVWQEATTLQQAGYEVSIICPVGEPNQGMDKRHEVIVDMSFPTGQSNLNLSPSEDCNHGTQIKRNKKTFTRTGTRRKNWQRAHDLAQQVGQYLSAT